MDQKSANELRQKYPNHVPLAVAGKRLVAEGREPFASIGANIGTRQSYVRIYTERLIAFLNAELPLV